MYISYATLEENFDSLDSPNGNLFLSTYCDRELVTLRRSGARFLVLGHGLERGLKLAEGEGLVVADGQVPKIVSDCVDDDMAAIERLIDSLNRPIQVEFSDDPVVGSWVEVRYDQLPRGSAADPRQSGTVPICHGVVKEQGREWLEYDSRRMECAWNVSAEATLTKELHWTEGQRGPWVRSSRPMWTRKLTVSPTADLGPIVQWLEESLEWEKRQRFAQAAMLGGYLQQNRNR